MQALPTEVRRICQVVLQALIGDAPELPVKDRSASARLACCVRIDGAFRGQVLVHASPGLAGLVASRMFGRPIAAPYASEAQEAMREMTNIIAGNVRACLGKHTNLGLPEDLPLDEPGPDVPPLAEVVIDQFGERLEVRVFDL